MTTPLYRHVATFAVSLLMISAAAAASPVENVEENFTRIDRDGDGQLSRAEIGAFDWLRYDTDSSGAVTNAEFVTGRAFDKKLAETTADPQLAWQVLDWNHDGYLSGFELDGKWEKYDFDTDGKVQKHEFITARTGPAVMPAPPAGVVVPVAPANDPAPAAVDAQTKSLWGATLAVAQQSDLFQFFNLERVGQGILLEAGTQWNFQPKQGPFRELVMIKLTENRDTRKIVAAELLLQGSFVQNPKTDVFARDLAKSFVAQLTPAAHAAATRDLVNELQFGAPNMVRLDGAAGPKLPDPPTAGYQAYLGKRENFTQMLGDVQLFILPAAAGDDWLLISLQPAPEETM